MEKTAIVFIHGYMGSSAQFENIIECLDQSSFTIYRLTLPGHETTLAHFVETKPDEWQVFVNRYVAKLRNLHKKILLVGHSLGGVLAIQAAIHQSENIVGVVAIALPLYVKVTYRTLEIRLRAIGRPSPNEPPEVRVSRKLSGVSDVQILNSIRLLPNTIELLRIFRETRKVLSQLSVKLLIVQSANDELVSARSARFVLQALPDTQSLVLQSATHFMYPSEEALLIARTIRDFAVSQ